MSEQDPTTTRAGIPTGRRRPAARALLPLLVAVSMTVAAVPVGATPERLLERHIVVLHEDAAAEVDGAVERLLAPLGLRAEQTFAHALSGFTVVGPPEVISLLDAHPSVASVERDGRVTATAQTVPVGIDRVDARGTADGASTDVDIAIIDTGIAEHPDLRVHRRVDCRSAVGLPIVGDLLGLLGGGNEDRPACAEGGKDDNGHGTHVAGTAAASDDGSGVVGVAPGARLWAVKVLGGPLGSGSVSDVIAGIDYVTAHADEIEVANLSLGGPGSSPATDAAIAGATAAGVVVVAAAGNDGADAAGFTPASAPDAITVSAITDLDGVPGGLAEGDCSGGDDEFATYSNFGSVVDIAAPGSCVVSTSSGGGTTELSGTSMAAPHVAGAAARYIAEHDVARDGRRPEAVRAGLLGTAAAQDGPCGFSNGRSGEPLLDLDGC